MNDYLSASELKKITGTNEPAKQVAALRRGGFNPWVHPETGVPLLYRDVFKEAQAPSDKIEHVGVFEMNLDALDAAKTN